VPDSLTYAAYRRILPAPDGAIWFMEYDQNGADIYNPSTQSWQRPPEELRDGVPLGWDTDGNLWLGGWGHISIIGAQRRTDLGREQGFPDGVAQALAFTSDGTAWVGTSAGLVSIQDMKITGRPLDELGIEWQDVNALLTAQDGSLWAAVGTEIIHRSPGNNWETIHPDDLFDGGIEQVTGIAEAADGTLWFSTYGDGVYRLAGGDWERFNVRNTGEKLPSDYASDVEIGPDGSVWLALPSNGAARYDGQSWLTPTVADGLVSNEVKGVYAAPDGSIWFACQGGVTHYTP
jgi:ligand-binding sensor domain-containing protein